MKKLFALVAVVVAMLLVVAGCGTTAKTLALPADAVKLTDVIPQMGEHWANPAQLPLGPIYNVYKGEVIGLEYMWSEDMMQEVSIPTPAGPEEFMALTPLPVGVAVDHIDVTFMEHGHEGFEVPHWDMHMYFITQEEKANVMPGG